MSMRNKAIIAGWLRNAESNKKMVEDSISERLIYPLENGVCISREYLRRVSSGNA